MKFSTILAAATASVLLLLLAAGPAGAQEGLALPNSSDRTMQWLENLFPGLAGNAEAEGPVGVLGALMRIFSLALLSIGVLWISWTSTTAVIQSAREGIAFGQAISTFWAPVRILFGFSTLIPLPGGYPLISHFVFLVAGWGIGLGNTLWDATVDQLLGEARPIVREDQLGIRALAGDLLVAETCRAIINRYQYESYKDDPVLVQRFDKQPIEWLPGRYVFGVSYDGVPGSGLPPAVCGRFEAELAEPEGIVRGIVPSPDAIWGRQYNATLAIARALEPLADAFAQAHIDSREAREATAADLADPDALEAEVKRLVDLYMNSQGDFVARFRGGAQAEGSATAGAEENAFVAELKNGGWSAAGTWWLKLSQINTAIMDYVQTLPEMEVAPLGGGDDVLQSLRRVMGDRGSEAISRTLGSVQAYKNEAFLATRSDLAGYLERRRGHTVAAQEVAPSEKSFWAEVFATLKQSLMQPVFGILWLFTQNSADNPMGSIVNFGHGLIALTFAGTAGLTTAATVGAMAVGNLATPGGSGPLSMLYGISVLTVVLPLFVIGAYFAFILPATVFIHFSLGVIGWLILVAEGIIAAPLWVLLHMRLDGENFAHQSVLQGYQIMLGILLRPALMILGYVLAIAVLYLGIGFIGDQFTRGVFEAVGISTGVGGALLSLNPASLIVGGIAYLFLMFTLVLQVAKIAMRLMTTIPDTILTRWLGGPAIHGQDEQDTHNVVAIANVQSARVGAAGRNLPNVRRGDGGIGIAPVTGGGPSGGGGGSGGASGGGSAGGGGDDGMPRDRGQRPL